jgi:hypothetical protein
MRSRAQYDDAEVRLVRATQRSPPKLRILKRRRARARHWRRRLQPRRRRHGGLKVYASHPPGGVHSGSAALVAALRFAFRGGVFCAVHAAAQKKASFRPVFAPRWSR